MGKVLDKFNEIINSDSDMRLVVFRGVMAPLGGIPAADFKYTEKKTAYFRGNIAPMVKFYKDGEEKTFPANLPLVAFGEAAEDLACAGEGLYVLVLAELNRKKSQDGKQWFTEGNVIAAEVIG